MLYKNCVRWYTEYDYSFYYRTYVNCSRFSCPTQIYLLDVCKLGVSLIKIFNLKFDTNIRTTKEWQIKQDTTGGSWK